MATPTHIDDTQPSTNACCAASMIAGASAPALAATANALPMPSLACSAASGGQPVEGGLDGAAVAGAQDRPEQRDAEGTAQFARGVVQRRRHALLLRRERGGDRLGGRGHGEAHAEAEDHQTRQDRHVAALDGCPQRQGREAGAEDRHTGDHRHSGAEPRRDPRCDGRRRHHHDRHRQEAGRGLECRPAEDGLQVGEEHEEDAEHDGEHDEQGARTGRQTRDRGRRDMSSSGSFWRSSHITKPTAARTPTTIADEGDRVAPAALGSFVDAEHDATDRQCRQDRADDVETVLVVLPRVGDGDQRS